MENMNGWNFQDELEKYQAKLQFKKMLLGWHESRMQREIHDGGNKLDNLKQATRKQTLKLEEIANNLPAIGSQVLPQTAKERCLDLGKKLNELRLVRKTNEQKLRSSRCDLQMFGLQLRDKQEQLQTQRKTIADLQSKLDGIISKQKTTMENHLKLERVHDELQKGNLAFLPLIKEMDMLLNAQGRDLDELEILFKVEVAKGSSSEKRGKIRTLMELVEDAVTDLTSRKEEYETTLRKLDEELTGKREVFLGDAETPSTKQAEPESVVKQIGDSADRLLSVLISAPRKSGDDQHVEEFLYELLSVARVCREQTNPRLPSVTDCSSVHSGEFIPYDLKRCRSLADLVIQKKF